MTDQEIMLRCIEARSRGSGVLPVGKLLSEAEDMFKAVKAKPGEPADRLPIFAETPEQVKKSAAKAA